MRICFDRGRVVGCFRIQGQAFPAFNQNASVSAHVGGLNIYKGRIETDTALVQGPRVEAGGDGSVNAGLSRCLLHRI